MTASRNVTKWKISSIMVLGCLMLVDPAAGEGNLRIGGGVHYWRTIDDLRADDFAIENDGFSYLGSVQFLFNEWVKIEGDLEYFPDDFGAAGQEVWSPQGLFLLGSGLYGGLGVGTFYTDGDFGEDPFFLLRVGFDLEVLPSLRLDFNANYQFTNFDSISQIDENVDTDTITLGAMFRFEF
jgi:hypothetical protein